MMVVVATVAAAKTTANKQQTYTSKPRPSKHAPEHVHPQLHALQLLLILLAAGYSSPVKVIKVKQIECRQARTSTQ